MFRLLYNQIALLVCLAKAYLSRCVTVSKTVCICYFLAEHMLPFR